MITLTSEVRKSPVPVNTPLRNSFADGLTQIVVIDPITVEHPLSVMFVAKSTLNVGIHKCHSSSFRFLTTRFTDLINHYFSFYLSFVFPPPF